MPGNRLVRLVGTALRRQRELHRLTQQELADRAGTSQATVARIERGDRVPSLPMLETLFAALDVQLAVTVEPLDAHLDARMADLGSRSIVERIAGTDIDRVMDALSDIPYVFDGSTAALLHGAPVPVDAVHLTLRWQEVDAFTTWLTRTYAHRWNAKWQQFGYLALDPREPGEPRWETVAGEIRATMCEELPRAVEVRHGQRVYPAVPLADVEVADPVTADLLQRYRDRQGRSAG